MWLLPKITQTHILFELTDLFIKNKNKASL
jgi:hypothetical protein